MAQKVAHTAGKVTSKKDEKTGLVSATAEPIKIEPGSEAAKTEAVNPNPEVPDVEGAFSKADAKVSISSNAKELADKHGLDLAKIEGSGRDGKIIVSDVKAAIEAAGSGEEKKEEENEEKKEEENEDGE